MNKKEKCLHENLKWYSCEDCNKDFTYLDFDTCEHKRATWNRKHDAYECDGCGTLATPNEELMPEDEEEEN